MNAMIIHQFAIMEIARTLKEATIALALLDSKGETAIHASPTIMEPIVKIVRYLFNYLFNNI